MQTLKKAYRKTCKKGLKQSLLIVRTAQIKGACRHKSLWIDLSILKRDFDDIASHWIHSLNMFQTSCGWYNQWTPNLEQLEITWNNPKPPGTTQTHSKTARFGVKPPLKAETTWTYPKPSRNHLNPSETISKLTTQNLYPGWFPLFRWVWVGSGLKVLEFLQKNAKPAWNQP